MDLTLIDLLMITVENPDSDLHCVDAGVAILTIFIHTIFPSIVHMNLESDELAMSSTCLDHDGACR